MIADLALLIFCYGVARLLLDTTRKADGQVSMFGQEKEKANVSNEN